MASFLTDLWNGKYPLAKTFWLYSVLGNIVVGIVVALSYILICWIPLINILALPIACVALLGYDVICIVGTWRAADAYRGEQIWAILAKIFAILWAIGVCRGVLWGI